LQDQSSKRILKNSIQLKPLRKLVLAEPNVQSARIIIGAIPKSGILVVIPSKHFSANLSTSCIGQYTFINDGIGKGHKISFAEAWTGKLSIFLTCIRIRGISNFSQDPMHVN
jgi:hypothetical protein